MQFLVTVVLLASALLAGCAARAPVPIEMLKDPPCSSASGIRWAGPKAPIHRSRLSDWCESVGPLVFNPQHSPQVEIAESGLIVLTWNQHEGFGDLDRLLRSLVGRSPVIALVQEVARASDSVPLDVPATVRVPTRIGPPKQINRDIAVIAGDLRMSLAYLPSMANGSRTQEDRGCAILSSLPMSDVVGIELPWVAQRRVAVMATVTAMKNGAPWPLRVVSMHLANRGGRSQQAAALADFLTRQEFANSPIVIGGDLNAWWGIQDRAVREINRVVPRIPECGKRATFRFGLRLDHFFTTLRPESRAGCFVERDRFGSDHHPIILRLFKAL